MPLFVVHYKEIGIKGENRAQFEDKLLANIRHALRIRGLDTRKEFGRLRLATDALDPAVITERLSCLPGIGHFAQATSCPRELEAMSAEAVAQASAPPGGAGRGPRGRAASFRIDTRRSDKTYPMTSVEVNRRIGAAVQQATAMRVDLERPELTVTVEITRRDALVYTRRIDGPGGLPVGISGRLVVLLSGGIDSPVAAFRMMRRGSEVVLLHFHNYSRHQEQVRDKIVALARVLTRFQLRTRLWLVPFEELQAAIVAAVPAEARMIAYRRVMLRLGETLLAREGALGFVTGDSVGQVASQTLENLRAIHAATTWPIYSPLIGDDKDQIVAEARRIGTYDISVRPYEDCCSFLVARHPTTRVRLEPLLEQEARIPVEELGRKAIDAAELHELTLERPAGATAEGA